MKKIYFLLLIFIFSSCSQDPFDKRFQLSEKEKIVNKLERKATSDLQKKYGLIPVGTGGQMMNEVKKLRLIFNYPYSLTEDGARALAIKATEDYLVAINKEESLRQYLANYPFGPKNVEITIFLQDSRGRSIQPDQFDHIKSANGFITCKADVPETNKYRIVFKETFEEAKYKVASQQHPLAPSADNLE